MPVLAANCTKNTNELIYGWLDTDSFVKFALQNKLNLHDDTLLIRLALINLKNNLPTNEELAKYKVSLLRPHEFDNYLESHKLEGDIL